MVSKKFARLQELAQKLPEKYQQDGDRIAAEIAPVEDAISKIRVAYTSSWIFDTEDEGTEDDGLGYRLCAAKAQGKWGLCYKRYRWTKSEEDYTEIDGMGTVASLAIDVRVRILDLTKGGSEHESALDRFVTEYTEHVEKVRSRLIRD